MLAKKDHQSDLRLDPEANTLNVQLHHLEPNDKTYSYEPQVSPSSGTRVLYDDRFALEQLACQYPGLISIGTKRVALPLSQQDDNNITDGWAALLRLHYLLLFKAGEDTLQLFRLTV